MNKANSVMRVLISTAADTTLSLTEGPLAGPGTPGDVGTLVRLVHGTLVMLRDKVRAYIGNEEPTGKEPTGKEPRDLKFEEENH